MPPEYGVPTFDQYLEPSDVWRIINSCENERDRLVLETMWESGGRVSEVLALTPEWIGETSLILPNLKQRVEAFKEVTVSADLCLRLKDFADKSHIAEGSCIFRSPGNPGKPMGRNYVWRLVTRLSGELGIARVKKGKGLDQGEGTPEFRNAWPHLFRHSSAMHILEETGSTEVTQHQLGHSSIITTQGYARTKDLSAKESLGKVDWNKGKEEKNE